LSLREPGPDEPYGRTPLSESSGDEVIAMQWQAGATCAPHDHGDAGGVIHVVSGAVLERRHRWTGRGLEVVSTAMHRAPAWVEVPPGCIHDMTAIGAALTIHRYAPRVVGMRVWDVAGRRTLVVADDRGAWVPRGGEGVLEATAWPLPEGA
jgi:predicted metal-dependent enzyme (double-stranded beta helix superfamily)